MSYTYHSKEKIECIYCGDMFQPTTHRNTTCPECKDFFKTYSSHRAKEKVRSDKFGYTENELRILSRTIARVKNNDHIVAEGYAQRQKNDTLEIVGRVVVEH